MIPRCCCGIIIYIRLDIWVQEASKGKITMDLVTDQNDLDLWFTDESSLILQNTWSAPSCKKWMVHVTNAHTKKTIEEKAMFIYGCLVYLLLFSLFNFWQSQMYNIFTPLVSLRPPHSFPLATPSYFDVMCMCVCKSCAGSRSHIISRRRSCIGLLPILQLL